MSTSGHSDGQGSDGPWEQPLEPERGTVGIDTPMVDEGPFAEELDQEWSKPPGLYGHLATVQNGAVGMRLILTGLFFLLLGGSVDSIVMRLQLARPEMDLVGPQLYNEMFTNHGSVTMFLVILPIFEGFAILLLPMLLGTREMAFPRLGAFAYYTFLFGGLMYYSSTLFSAVPDAGWFGYTPLSGPEYSPDLALDFWVLGLGVAEVGAIAAALEISVSIFKNRAPGMTFTRLPLFAWAMLVTSFMILFAFTPLIVGSLLLELDRGFGTAFFDPGAGGSSLLWQHLFWIFGHPEVYIQFLPATGIVSMIVPVFARRRTEGYPWIVAATVAIGFLSFGLWAHHMFTVGLAPVVLGFFAAASMVIAIPAGVQIFAWLATIWLGRPVWRTPFLFVVGFMAMFVLGGITGVMVASVPFDGQAHDSYFVVAHLHYVLIGGVVFPMFAGVYFWFPKFVGKMMDERLGRLHFWLLFVGANMTFFPMHIVGLMGMPRRIHTYPEGLGWGTYNLISTIGVFVMFGGIVAFGLNLWRSWRHGVPAGSNPWKADTLEWSTPSPPLQHGFSVPPIVTSRHPLWDQEELHRGDPQVEALGRAMGEWPLRWRANLTVGVTSARPEEVVRIAGPSIWPLVAAIGTVTIFAAELLKLRVGALAGAAVLVAAVIRWNWPESIEMDIASEEAFERRHGIPVRPGGSPVISRWAIGLAVLFLSIFLGALLLSYFYLRIENTVWPPPGFSDPAIGTGALAFIVIVVAAVSARRALAAVQAGDLTGMRIAAALAALAGLAAMVVVIEDLWTLDFGATEHAYGSIFFTLASFLLVIAAAGAIMATMVLWWSRGGRFSARHHNPVVVLWRYWISVAVMWAAGLFTLYLGPTVT
jgi:cytochrome c oxidase subunit I+III